jgi:DNA-binding beta-propeller fold protein YncE
VLDGSSCGVVVWDRGGRTWDQARAVVRETNGSVRWQSPRGVTPDVAASGLLYAHTKGTLVAFDCASGREVLRSTPVGRLVEAVVPMDGGVIVVTDEAVSAIAVP